MKKSLAGLMKARGSRARRSEATGREGNKLEIDPPWPLSLRDFAPLRLCVDHPDLTCGLRKCSSLGTTPLQSRQSRDLFTP